MRTAFAKEITEIANIRNDVVLLSGDIGNRMFDDLKKSKLNGVEQNQYSFHKR